jgi:hypothetical protein
MAETAEAIGVGLTVTCGSLIGFELTKGRGRSVLGEGLGLGIKKRSFETGVAQAVKEKTKAKIRVERLNTSITSSSYFDQTVVFYILLNVV